MKLSLNHASNSELLHCTIESLDEIDRRNLYDLWYCQRLYTFFTESRIIITTLSRQHFIQSSSSASYHNRFAKPGFKSIASSKPLSSSAPIVVTGMVDSCNLLWLKGRKMITWSGTFWGWWLASASISLYRNSWCSLWVRDAVTACVCTDHENSMW